MNNLSGFERNVRQTLNQHEPPYDPKSWDRLEQHLSANASGGNTSLWVGIAAASILTAGGIFYFVQSEQGIAATSLQSDALLLRDSQVVREAQPESSENLYVVDAADIAAVEETTAETSSLLADNNDTPTSSASEELNITEGKENTTPDNSNNDNNESLPAAASIAAFSASAVEVCVGEEVTFDLVNSQVSGNFLWNFGDGDFDIRETPSHSFNAPGEYDVSLSITEAESGSIFNSPIGQRIVVRQKPQAAFSKIEVETSLKSTVIQFQNESHKADQCLWYANGQMSTEINPEFEFQGKGKYLVKLYVENDNGCADSLFQYVEIKDDIKLGAPSELSLASGDVFMPSALKDPDVYFRMTIYDQKTPIFESVSSHLGWDGTLENGQPAELNQKYTWIVTIIENGKEKSAYSGSLKIIP